MPSPTARFALPCAFVLALLASCSEPGEPNPTMRDEPARPAAEAVSEADREAAQALSLSSRGAPPEAATPYQQAVACSTAIALVTERLGQSEILTGEQAQALEGAKAVYDRRARALASQGATAPPADPDASNASALSEAEDLSAKAMQAINCLQSLEQTR